MVAEVTSSYGDEVEVEEINTFTKEGIERGLAKQVMSVPSIFIDGKLKFVGFPFSREDLIASIEEALPSRA